MATKELADEKKAAQRALDRAGETYSITAWQLRTAHISANSGAVTALKARLSGHKAALDGAIAHHDEVMERWYQFHPADRNKIGVVILPQNVYVR